MGHMFADASIFDQDISGWCVERNFSAPSMFAVNSNLQQEHQPRWGHAHSKFGKRFGGFVLLQLDTALGKFGYHVWDQVYLSNHRSDKRFQNCCKLCKSDPVYGYAVRKHRSPR
eukprot:scaffold239_cov382-Pavlova_lutheri.AAC.9